VVNTGIKWYNNLPLELKNVSNYKVFKKKLKCYLLTSIMDWPSHRRRGFKSPHWVGWNIDGAGYSLERKLFSQRWKYNNAVLTVGTCSAIS
jgi:hypothetical protein